MQRQQKGKGANRFSGGNKKIKKLKRSTINLSSCGEKNSRNCNKQIKAGRAGLYTFIYSPKSFTIFLQRYG